MKKISIVAIVMVVTLCSFYFVKTNTPTPLPAVDCGSTSGLTKVICLAEAFKATLTDKQQAELQLPYTKASAARWSNFPEFAARPRRVGLKMATLNDTQLAAAKALMASVLATSVSNEGYDELEAAMAADEYFGTVTGKKDVFFAGNYYMAFLGVPSATGLWELQFGGHHFAFANTYNKGVIAGVTPSFRGVEPMAVFTQQGKTYQPMEQERAALARLLNSLEANEQATAKIKSTFSDLLLGPDRDNQFPQTKLGLRVGDLTEEKQKLVMEAMKLYINDLDATTAAAVLNRYKSELAETYLAYSGTVSMDKVNDYVRLDGPGIWLEYSAQPSRDFPGTVHPHSVWRDHGGDYGGN